MKVSCGTLLLCMTLLSVQAADPPARLHSVQTGALSQSNTEGVSALVEELCAAGWDPVDTERPVRQSRRGVSPRSNNEPGRHDVKKWQHVRGSLKLAPATACVWPNGDRSP